MAGNKRLTGKNAIASLKLLNEITDQLDASNIPYQLDAGTLLGVVRESRLLPWDNDMDIWVDSSYLPQLLDCLSRFERTGYKTRVRRHVTDDAPISKSDVRVIKVKNRKWFFLSGDAVLDIFVKYEADDHFYWIEGDKNYVKKKVPSSLVSESVSIPFNGKAYSVPKNNEEYLTYRYGDWKTPVKTWNNFTDDKALDDK